MEQKEETPKKKIMKRLILNISMTQYEVVRDVGKKLKFRVTIDKEPSEFDLLWTDMAV